MSSSGEVNKKYMIFSSFSPQTVDLCLFVRWEVHFKV